MLVSQLPVDSAFAVSLGRPAGWGNTEELLALVAELIDGTNRTLIMAHSKRGTPPPKALQVPRPHTAKRRRPATSEDLVEMFGSIAKYSGTTARDE